MRRPIRWNEMALCQYGGCDELRSPGTDYCASHLGVLRRQAALDLPDESPEPFEFCADDECWVAGQGEL